MQRSKKKKNRNHNEDKNRSTETGPELTQMIEVVEKDIKTVIITVIHMFKKVEMLKYSKRDRICILKTQSEFEEPKNITRLR